MKKWKLFALLVAVLVIPMFFGLAQPVKAATNDQVTITLHKVAFEGQLPEDKIVNTGGEITDWKGGKPLSGITFEVYDVTNDFYQWQTANPGKAAEAAQMAIAKKAENADYLTGLAKLAAKETGADGVIDFSLPKTSAAKNAAYLFVERLSDKVQSPADPVVIALPVYQGNKELSVINVYLKNVQKTTPSTTPSTTPHGKNLPKTGEARTSTLTLIGLLIIAVVLLYFWRRKTNEKRH
ncbi:pilin N-terminal domain-containing protein [Enterococcus hirae]|nr:pilin N-terminal domain-containing protein [Enterococcus hirae]